MRDWLEKKSVKSALVLALIVVWGYNSYSIVGMSSDNETANQHNELNVDVTGLKIPEIKRFSYSADFRDPFIPGLRKNDREEPAAKQETDNEPIRVPNLSLTGVIEEMALIQNQGQQLFFVSAGDTVEGAQIRFVTEDSVGLIIKEKKFNLQFDH